MRLRTCFIFIQVHEKSLLPPFHHLLQLHPHDLASSDCLQQRQDFGQTLVSQLLELTQQACLKEHLHEAKSQERNKD